MSTIFSSLWSRPVTSVPYLKGGTPSLLDGTSNILVWPRLWIWDESFREEEGGVRRIREKEEQVLVSIEITMSPVVFWCFLK